LLPTERAASVTGSTNGAAQIIPHGDRGLDPAILGQALDGTSGTICARPMSSVRNVIIGITRNL